MANVTDNAYNSDNGASNLFYIDLRVYIAGVYIPVSSVYINSSFSGIPTATVTLPPYQELFTIGRMDRVPIHIFMCNRFISDNKYNYQNKTIAEGETKYQVGEPLLIFEGEISGFGYLSDGGGREFVINAHSHFSFLRDLKVRFITSAEEMDYAYLPGEFLTSLQKFDQTTAFPLSLFTDGFTLGSSSKTSHSISYPTKLLQNMFELITNRQVLDSFNDKSENALIDFYQPYCKDKLKVTNRVVPLPYVDVDPKDSTKAGVGFPLLKLLVQDQTMAMFNSFLRSNIPITGGTLWDVIYSVFSKMEYDISILPSPTYSPSKKTLNSIIAKPMLYDAIPPACNIIFRNQIKSLRVDEVTYGVPTRLRLKDINKTIITPTTTNSAFDLFNRLNYYPSKYYTTPTPSDTPKRGDLFVSELLDTEKHTGPYLIDRASPEWTTFVGSKLYADDSAFIQALFKSMLMLSIYENRQITVTMDYNPFVVTGAPAIVFDVIPNGKNVQGLTFIGYVLSCQHSITRNSMRTSITLGYSRTIQEDFVEDTRLYNSYKDFSKDITQVSSKMDEIYSTMYGCTAMPVTDEDPIKAYSSFYSEYYTHATQNDPRASYAFQERRLTTMDEYLSYMGLSASKTTKTEDGDQLILQFTDNSVGGGGDGASQPGYISDRKDSELIAKLVVIQDKCLSNKIYNFS